MGDPAGRSDAELALSYALVAHGAAAPFWHHEPGRGAVQVLGVPDWAVAAYAAARLARRPVEPAILGVVDPGALPDLSVGRWVGRALTARLGQLERRVRGAPPAPVSTITEGREPDE
jgi:hypothetical protein